MLTKNEPVLAVLWKIPARMVLDSISAWKSLFEGQSNYFFAVAQAHLAYIGWVLGNKRKSIFPKVRSGKLAGWYPHSIVWKHFVKGQKRFLEIMGNKR